MNKQARESEAAYRPGIDGPALDIHKSIDRQERMPYWTVSRGRGESAVFQSWIYGEKRAEQLAQKFHKAIQSGGDWKRELAKTPREASDKQAAIQPTVEGFIMYLTGALTQYDQRAAKRRGYNPYALGHYMKAVGEIRKDTAKHKMSQEPEALEALKQSISRHFLSNMPPANKTLKAIDKFMESGKAPRYPMPAKKRNASERVVDRFIEAQDPYMTVEEIADLCLKCAYTLMADGREGARHSEIRQMLAGKWETMPKGWTDESRKKMWNSLVGDVKHKVTKCIKAMDGKVDDAGAFCAALADRVEGKEWRSEKKAAKEPNPEQLKALKDYANWAGKDWKKSLSKDWMRSGSRWDGPWHLMQQLRNQLGPKWLAKYTLK